jgi:hypothetical protein
MLMLVQVFLLTVFLMLIHSVMASFPTRWIARVNSAGSTFNIIALAIVLIIIPAACDRTAFGLSKFNSNKAVWGNIYEGTDFAPGVSVLMSFVSVICKCLHDHRIITNIHLRSMILPGTMSGYDSPFHLAEECSNASIASPRAIFMTSAIGGIVGWLLQLVVAYTVVDITAVLESDLGQPFAAFLNDILPQRIVLAVLSLTIISGFAMGQGCMIAASRVSYASQPWHTDKDNITLTNNPGLRPRRLLSPLPPLAPRKYPHPHPRQRRLAQHHNRRPPPPANLRRRPRHRRDIQHRRLRGFRFVRNPHRHPRVFRRRPLPAWTVEFGTGQCSDWGCGVGVC